jgi:hypothetical protein
MTRLVELGMAFGPVFHWAVPMWQRVAIVAANLVVLMACVFRAIRFHQSLGLVFWSAAAVLVMLDFMWFL